jgi:HAD superfamily hydrolase (TIGR01509 family)
VTSGTVRGVLFDLDGTLVDSVDAHTRAWVAALSEAGHEARYEAVRGLIGMGGDKLLPVAVGVAADSAEGRRISARRREVFVERELRHIQPTPGAAALLQALRGAGVRIGFATSAQTDELKALLTLVSASDLLERAADASDVTTSKPEPDVVRAALRKNDLGADEAILIGDTDYDIRAAAAAGVPAIALRSGGWRDEDLRGAIAIFDHPADLLANGGRTPLAPLLGGLGASAASAASAATT